MVFRIRIGKRREPSLADQWRAEDIRAARHIEGTKDREAAAAQQQRVEQGAAELRAILNRAAEQGRKRLRG